MNETNNYLSRATARRRRRRAYIFFMACGAAVFLLLGGGSWLFISSPLFKIGKIDIAGNNLVSQSDVLNLLNTRITEGAWWKSLFGFGNMLVWPDKIIGAGDLVFYPAIKSVSISKNYFNRTVFVKIEERQPIGIWCYRGTQINTGINADTASSSSGPRQSAYNPRESATCWWFDDEGVIFRRSPTTQGNLIAIVKDYSQTGGGLNSKILPDRFMKNFLSVIRVMQKSSLNEKEILLKDLAVEEVEVLTGSGSDSGGAGSPKLYFSLRFPADSALAAIEHLQEKPGLKNLKYIDFRVENKVYYK